MNKKLLYFTLLILPTIIFAASGEGSEGGTDIIPRTINFVIFAAILYYMMADSAKEFLLGRKNSIADKLNSIQEKLKDSKKEREEAKELIIKAKTQAKSIVEQTEKEIESMKSKILAELDDELEVIKKSFEDQIQIEKRKMTREIISEVLDEAFKEDSLSLKEDKMLDIIMKKVA